MIEEQWLPIEGFPNYLISNLGRVYSKTSSKIIKAKQVSGKKYFHVGLYIEGKQLWNYVHRLVAKAFIPNPDGLTEVNHKDEDPSNNIVNNLEWVNHKENIRYSTAIPVKATDVVTGGVLIYPSMRAAEKDGFNSRLIGLTCKGTHSQHKGYFWQYKEEEYD